MRAPLLLLTVLMAVVPPALAQTRRVSGVVARVGAGEPRPARVVAVRAERTDTALLDAEGRFIIEVPRGAVSLRVESVDSADYYPALLQVPEESPDGGWGLVLVPRRWAIAAGRYVDTTVGVDLAAAFDRPCASCPVFFGTVGRGPEGAVFARTGSSRRLRVAFDRSGSAERASAADSVAFWNAVEEMERDAGMELFEPASYAAVAADPEDGVVVWADRTLGEYAGWGGIGADGQGRIRSAMVALRSFTLIHREGGSGLVTHEMVHALGFGHTCAWPSVVADQRCPVQHSERLTVDDVAYLQLAAAVQEAGRRIGVSRPWDPTLTALRLAATP